MPIGDFSKSGLLGGMVAAEEDVMKRETFDLEKEEKQLNLRKKAMEVADTEYETPTRRSEADVKRQRAEREKSLAPKLDRQAEEQVNTSILKLESQQDLMQLNNIANLTQGASDQATYDEVMRNMSPAQRDEWGLSGDFNKDKNTLKYINERSLHSLEQLQALEQIGMRGRYATAASAARASGQTWTPPGINMPMTGLDLGQIATYMTADQDFVQLYTNGMVQALGGTGDPTTSEEFQQAVTYAGAEATSLLAENEQARRNDKSGSVRRLTYAEAQDAAVQRTKAFLYRGVERNRQGTPEIVLSDPSDAEAAYNVWKRESMAQAMQNEEFRGLPPIRQDRVLREAYYEVQAALMNSGIRRVATVVDNRSE